MSSRGLKHSKVHRINGEASAIPPSPKADSSAIEDAFQEARQNTPANEFTQETQETTQGFNDDKRSELPQLEVVEEFELPEEDEPAITEVVEIPTPKKSRLGGVFGGIAFVVSFAAIALAAYTLKNQQAGQETTKQKFSDIDLSITKLNTRTDEMAADLMGVKGVVQRHSDQLEKVDQLHEQHAYMQARLQGIRGDLTAVKGSLKSQGRALTTHKNNLTQLSTQFNTTRTQVDTLERTMNKEIATRKQQSTHPQRIEDAYLAAIDLWGTAHYVVLKGKHGNWIPLTQGEVYKGWRLETSTDTEAVFRKGQQRKQLALGE